MSIPVISRIRTAIRPYLQELRRCYLVKVWGMNIGRGCEISFSAKLDKTNPRGIYIGDETLITIGAVVLSHDFVNNRSLVTRIGRRCFIGARSIIMPGVEVGDSSIVGAGSVVVRDVPPRSVVVGNPARVIQSDIETGPGGMKAAAWQEAIKAKGLREL
jgi:acetyltransferase-like isoleucine patch superfamily enzyme